MAHVNPSRPPGLAPRLERRVGSWVETLARALALVGGIILVALVVMSVISIFGRGIGSYSRTLPFLRGFGPVPGDFELVEAGTAVAVFAFLPWCQLRRGHVTVDVFLMWTTPRVRAALSLAGNVLMTVAAAFIAWRLGLGLQDKMAFRETTMILGMPVWYGYAAALVGAWAFCLVSLYTVWRSVNEVARAVDGASDESGFGDEPEAMGPS
jgi:TRAP-type C4-dicarboxylate transport system permease small subunit